jgi:hypothetical protein
MDELLGGALAPVTREIGFIEADAEEAAGRFASWQSHLLLPPVRFVTRRVESRSAPGVRAGYRRSSLLGAPGGTTAESPSP